jgi:hypothetical protein
VTLLFASMACVIQVATNRVDAQAANTPVVVGSTTEIPGVVRNGTPIERILTGFNGLDDPIGLTDGSLLFSEPNTRRIHRLNTATNEVSVLVAESNESHGVTEDAKGRLMIIAWDIQPDGLVLNRRPFGTVMGRSTRDNGLGGVKSFADGMTIDDDGRLYVATGGGVEVLGPEGRHLGTIPVRCPPADCQNLAFSDPDKATLYVGGAGSLYRIAMVARGFRGRAK